MVKVLRGVGLEGSTIAEVFAFYRGELKERYRLNISRNNII